MLRDLAEDFLGELLVALAACGLLVLGWWGFRTAPYLTVSVAAGILLLAAYGVVAYVREVRGTRLLGGLGLAGVVAAAVVALLLSYLPACGCLL
ncbi:hypothetical protein SAMN05421684_4100 [Asanoa ishikariensis]|uniref:Uncharacterized protein n=1 Tax=Asanoa ishikariensis TaxID=137265 RepID=A0A1H3RQL4_9ACTN|nr:hypothetical protein [Asanoa ishikariensis]SDZ27923.1 hypothetical protein SAMN05421684_4100 [Asanoa ishikariensis]